MNEIRLFERYVAGNPGRGSQVQVGLEIPHRARADGGGLCVGCPGDDLHAGGESERRGGFRRERAKNVQRPPQVGQFLALDAGEGQQARVPINVEDVAVVSQPVQVDRVVGRRELPGQAQVDVILRLEELVGLAVDFRPFMADEQDVGDGILARLGGDAARAPQPGDQPPQAVTLELEQAADDLLDVGRAARVHPKDGVRQRLATPVYGGGGGIQAGNVDRQDVIHADKPLSEQPPRRPEDGLPPVIRALFHPSAGQEERLHRLELAGDDLAARGYQRHLWPG